MTTVETIASDTNTEHAALRELVLRASDVVAHYWPMRTFVHHNPLHSLEVLPFDEAIRRGRKFVGGHGYLPNETFRNYVRSGRIPLKHLDDALTPLVTDEQIALGTSQVRHIDVLRAHLLTGITAPADETIDPLIRRSPHRTFILELADHLIPLTWCNTSPSVSGMSENSLSRRARRSSESVERLTPFRLKCSEKKARSRNPVGSRRHATQQPGG